jgi:hypothetical protein
MMKQLSYFLCIIVVAASSYALPKHTPSNQATVNVDLFLVSTIASSQNVRTYFDKLAQQNPWIVLHTYVIDKDKVALQRFYKRLKLQHKIDFSTPAFFFCDAHWIGFDQTKRGEKLILQGLKRCQQQNGNKLNWSTVSTIRNWSATYVAQQQYSPQYYQRINRLLSLACILLVLLFICGRYYLRNEKPLAEIEPGYWMILLFGLIVCIAHLI